MIRSYIKIAWRNLQKNKVFSLLNIFGLTLGIVCSSLILLWVESELKVNNFNENKELVYRIKQSQKYETYTFTHGSSSALLGPAMIEEVPGVSDICRTIEWGTSELFSIGDKSLNAVGLYAESSIFNLFTFPFLEGIKSNPFSQLNSIVLTQAAAIKFFGEASPYIGKSIKVNNSEEFVVSGVLQDIPSASSVQFEWLMPFEIYHNQNPWMDNWGNQSIATYVKLKPGISPDAVNLKLSALVQSHEPKVTEQPMLFNMKYWHLYNEFENGKMSGGGRIIFVRLFSIIAFIILLIACINFMNLATAVSIKRAKEVGVRKVMGVRKGELVSQFMVEALFMSTISSCLAIGVLFLVLPFFNLLVEKELILDFFKPNHLFALISLTLFTGLLGGSYPAIYLSSFKPIKVLKGLKINAKNGWIQKGLVVGQFTVSIVLIIGTIIIYQQIQHVKNRPLGLNKDNILMTEVNGTIADNYSVIKEKLLTSSLVNGTTLASTHILNGGNNTNGLTWLGKVPNTKVLVSTRYVTPDFMNTLGMNIGQGRDFTDTDVVDGNVNNVIITQSFQKVMGDDSALGKVIRYADDPDRYQYIVVGVVEDYVYGNMYGHADPVMFIPTQPVHTSVMYAKLNNQIPVAESTQKMGQIFNAENPAFPFEYQFLDDQFNQKFTNEILIGKLSRVFAFLAIFISCLGLFGLALNTTERRIKEIGIRKILGASIQKIMLLIVRGFVKLVLVSCLIALPIGWYISNYWLTNFSYRIQMSWWVFLVAIVVTLIIAIVTVSTLSIKAAVANPIKSLRTE